MSNTRIHCENGLVKALPRWRRSNPGENRLRRWPEHRRRRRKGGGGGWNPRGGVGKELPEGSPTPSFKYPGATLARLSGQSKPGYSTQGGGYSSPPGYSAQGGGYSGLGSQKLIHSKFSKIEVLLTKKLNSCARIRCLEIGWLR
jgi:hypothetical protein